MKQINRLHQDDYVGSLFSTASPPHNLDGQDAGKRISDAKYSAAAWAENVHWNSEATGSITASIEWWKKSTKGHRENMLSANFTEVGFGATLKSKSGKYYYCAVFAKPR